MASYSWQEYKRDTCYLDKWLIDRSNAILKRLNSIGKRDPSQRLNTTGAIRISDIVYVIVPHILLVYLAQ